VWLKLPIEACTRVATVERGASLEVMGGHMTRHTKVMMSLAAASAALMFAYPDVRADDENQSEVSGSVAGLTGTCPSVRFKIGDQIISTDGNTDFQDGDCADVKNGEEVHVEGYVGADGVLLAGEVDFD
jgi:hypothetical protein